MNSTYEMPVRPAQPIALIDLKAQRHRLGDRIDRAMARVVEHGGYIMGPEVSRFEEQLAAHSGVRHAVSCASGTDALLLPLMARGIGAGDAVFLPAFTFTATAEVIALLGASPVFVDVDPVSFNLDTASLRAAVDWCSGRSLRPAAVIAVDLFGQPADYPAIASVAREHGLLLIEDAAQSYGASLDGRKVGALADVAATSFFPAKPLGCYGDGGAVLTDDDEMAARCRSLRLHGKGEDKYDIAYVGLNSRLDTLQAAILIEKLAIFDDELAARQEVAGRYHAALANRAQVPLVADTAVSAWAQYTIQVNGDRDRVAAALKSRGVPSAVYYPRPLHRQPAYRDYALPAGVAPVSERLCERVLSLPMHPYLDAATQEYISAALCEALEEAGAA